MALEVLSGEALAPVQSQQAFVVSDVIHKDIILPVVNVNAYERSPSKFLRQELDECDNYKQKVMRTPAEKLPVTYGDTYMTTKKRESPIDICLTPKQHWCTRQLLDCILMLEPLIQEEDECGDEEMRWVLNRKIGSAKIEKFLSNNTDRPYIQLSSHYGISTTLELNQTVSKRPRGATINETTELAKNSD